ncbi:hypothetical protein LCGC14_1306880 [marine sediment metagenome]|uniref:Ryanodine receptor Ryr domain-containing protein n=1 Tax=marine sediment metagenome TaxID=412755 RepID=A0A0F9L899_9ZZZZ
MGKYEEDASWNERPTDDQLRSIRRAWRILGYDFTEEDIPPTRWEARNLQFDLWAQVRAKGKKK